MLFHGTIATALSGSLNGTVFSHNRGGPYARARTIPIDPDTAEQQALRDTMSELADTWATTLSTSQREAWANFAAANKHPNRIGILRPITGRAEFFRANIPRGQERYWLGDTLAAILDPSPIGPSCEISPSFAIAGVTLATATFALTWDAAEEWASEADSALLWYISNVQEPVINWFRTPYTLRASNTQAMAGANSVAIPSMAPIPTGKRLFWRARVTRADGRLSTPWTGRIDT